MAPPRSQHPDHEDEKSHPIFYLFLSVEISCLPTPPPPQLHRKMMMRLEYYIGTEAAPN